MQWFDRVARVLLITALVLLGAAIVRNVTDALSAAVPHDPVANMQSAER